MHHDDTRHSLRSLFCVDESKCIREKSWRDLNEFVGFGLFHCSQAHPTLFLGCIIGLKGNPQDNRIVFCVSKLSSQARACTYAGGKLILQVTEVIRLYHPQETLRPWGQRPTASHQTHGSLWFPVGYASNSRQYCDATAIIQAYSSVCSCRVRF